MDLHNEGKGYLLKYQGGDFEDSKGNVTSAQGKMVYNLQPKFFLILLATIPFANITTTTLLLMHMFPENFK